jgi:hypothetical protein
MFTDPVLGKFRKACLFLAITFRNLYDSISELFSSFFIPGVDLFPVEEYFWQLSLVNIAIFSLQVVL